MSAAYLSETWQEMQRDAAPDFVYLRTCHPKARKPHKCDSCRGPIQIGERHRLDVFTQDGEFCAVRVHTAPCWDSAAREGAGVLG